MRGWTSVCSCTSSSKLVFANPSKSFVTVIEVTLTGRKINVRVFLNDTETVMTVDDYLAPHDNGTDDNAVSKNVFFKLFKLIVGKWGYPAFKFRVYS